jgi:hypothetical protein
MSPTVFEVKNLKFKIYFKDHNPPHVHVEGRGAEAVFDLGSCICVKNSGFSQQAINKITEFVREKRAVFLEAWHDYQK